MVTKIAAHFDRHRGSITHARYLHLYRDGSSRQQSVQGDSNFRNEIVSFRFKLKITNKRNVTENNQQRKNEQAYQVYNFLRLEFGTFSDAKSKAKLAAVQTSTIKTFSFLDGFTLTGLHIPLNPYNLRLKFKLSSLLRHLRVDQLDIE